MIQFDRIGETLETATLENGLRIYYIPKPMFSKTFAMLATDFGSVDSSFEIEEGRLDTPAGVAHFLEHKMFEEEDGNALQKFSVTGASPNAFTSHTMTAYHFSCTDRFEENLRILLRFVYNPYFTEKNVEKEKGIIGQEIGMMEDTPFWRAFVGMFEGLYTEHPIRASIAGSIDSIAQIDPKLLYQCHEAFYSPSNMCLVICGTADFTRVMEIAREYTPATSKRIAARHYGKRRPNVCRSEVAQHMAVSRPQFILGIKDQPLADGESRMRRSIVGEIAVRLICGSTSPLFVGLYKEGLLNRKFGVDYSLFPEGAAALFRGESGDPQAVRECIEQEIRKTAAELPDAERVRRMKKTVYGSYVRLLDEQDEICRMQAEAAFAGENFGDFAEMFDKITAEEIQKRLRRWAEPDRTTLSVILPEEA